MTTPTTDELLRAMRSGTITTVMCGECSGSGTKFDRKGKSMTCNKCKGRRKLVIVPRDPYVMPMDNEWKYYLGDRK